MRRDCDNFHGLPEALNRNQFLVPRLTREQRRLTVESPVRLFGAEVTQRLSDRVLNDVGDHSDQLPVMQHAMMRTCERWRQSGDAALDLAHYESVGGIGDSLSRDAEAALGSLDEADREIAKWMFQALTDTDARNRRIRRPARLGEIAAVAQTDGDRVRGIIERFTTESRSFLTLSRDADPVVDISHESLIRQWPRMGDWVKEEAESRDLYLRLVSAANRREMGRGELWR